MTDSAANAGRPRSFDLSGPPLTVEHIVVPPDGSEYAERALVPARVSDRADRRRREHRFGLAQLTVGSQAARVVHESVVPVALVRAEQAT